MASKADGRLERHFLDAEKQAAALAAEISERVYDGVRERGHATIAVAGGRSPIRLFQLLSKTELPWASVTVTLTDERWLEPSDSASNEHLVREHLLVGRAAPARFVPLKNGAATPEEGANQGNAVLAKLSWPLDVIVLGMGEDGHTASLFPEAPELTAALDTSRDALCAAIRPATAPHARMSLSLRALQSSRWLVLPLQGEAKLNTYRRALEDGPAPLMPIRAVLRSPEVPLEVWISP